MQPRLRRGAGRARRARRGAAPAASTSAGEPVCTSSPHPFPPGVGAPLSPKSKERSGCGATQRLGGTASSARPRWIWRRPGGPARSESGAARQTGSPRPRDAEAQRERSRSRPRWRAEIHRGSGAEPDTRGEPVWLAIARPCGTSRSRQALHVYACRAVRRGRSLERERSTDRREPLPSPVLHEKRLYRAANVTHNTIPSAHRCGASCNHSVSATPGARAPLGR